MIHLPKYTTHEKERRASPILSNNGACAIRKLEDMHDQQHVSIDEKVLVHNVDIGLVFIQIEFVMSLIDNGSLGPNFIIIDVRENRFYQTKHVKGSINSSCHSKIMIKRSKQLWLSMQEVASDGDSTKKIFLYDNKSSSCDNTSSLSVNLSSFAHFLVGLGHEVFVLDGGWQSIHTNFGLLESLFESTIEKELIQRYSTSPTSNVSPCVDVLNAKASKIEDHLYLGNERDSKDLDLLCSLGITHILNVTHDVENYFDGSGQTIMPNHCAVSSTGQSRFTYYRLAASDSHSQDLYKFFNTAFEFIEQVRLQPNCRVFVHCWAGVSRSATIVIAYLMRRHHIDVQCGLERVFTKRSIIAPNLNFMGQLERYYRTEICPPQDGQLQHACQCSSRSLDLDNSVNETSLFRKNEAFKSGDSGDESIDSTFSDESTSISMASSYSENSDFDMSISESRIASNFGSIITTNKLSYFLEPLKSEATLEHDDSLPSFSFFGKCGEPLTSQSSEQIERAIVHLVG